MSSKKQINENPSEVIIIGNGLDLNLGLPTGYCDFVDSKYFTVLLDNGSNLCRHLKGVRDLQNWVDVEEELKEVEKNSSGTTFIEEYETLCHALIKYLNSLDFEKIDRSSIGYKLIQELVGKNYLVVDYNFTGIVEKILAENHEIEQSIEKNILQIHGSLKRNEIIFGVEDGHRLKNPKVNTGIIKSDNDIFDGNNLNIILRKATKVTFFGHSLGKTDHSDFKTYFINAAGGNYEVIDKNITVYYYGKESGRAVRGNIYDLVNQNLSGLKRINQFTMVDVLTPH